MSNGDYGSGIFSLKIGMSKIKRFNKVLYCLDVWVLKLTLGGGDMFSLNREMWDISSYCYTKAMGVIRIIGFIYLVALNQDKHRYIFKFLSNRS